MTAQRLALTGGYPDGVWSCAWCAAELADGGIAHREDCRWIADIAAKAHAAQRERLADAAGELKFTLYRPGNGPGAGTQALDVVPLTELLALLRDQPPATEGTTDAT